MVQPMCDTTCTAAAYGDPGEGSGGDTRPCRKCRNSNSCQADDCSRYPAHASTIQAAVAASMPSAQCADRGHTIDARHP